MRTRIIPNTDTFNTVPNIQSSKLLNASLFQKVVSPKNEEVAKIEFIQLNSASALRSL